MLASIKLSVALAVKAPAPISLGAEDEFAAGEDCAPDVVLDVVSDFAPESVGATWSGPLAVPGCALALFAFDFDEASRVQRVPPCCARACCAPAKAKQKSSTPTAHPCRTLSLKPFFLWTRNQFSAKADSRSKPLTENSKLTTGN
jgi:hypothetical protein